MKRLQSSLYIFKCKGIFKSNGSEANGGPFFHNADTKKSEIPSAVPNYDKSLKRTHCSLPVLQAALEKG